MTTTTRAPIGSRDPRRPHGPRHRARLDPHQGLPRRCRRPVRRARGRRPRVGEPARRRPLDLLAGCRLVGPAGRLRRPRGRRRVAPRRAPDTFAAIGISAMMHGYLAFDAERRAARAVPHLARHHDRPRGRRAHRASSGSTSRCAGRSRTSTRRCSTPSRTSPTCASSPRSPATCTGSSPAQFVLGIGDASGMFPIDDATRGYRADLLERFDALAAGRAPALAAPAARGAPRGGAGRHAHRRGRRAARPDRRAAARASRCARPRATPAPAWSRPTRSHRAPATSAPARASSRWSCSSARCRACTTSSTWSRRPPATRSRWCTATTARASSRRGCRSSASSPRPPARPSTRMPRTTRCSARRSTARRMPAASSPTTSSPANRSPGSPRAARSSCAPTTADSRSPNLMRAQLYGVFATLSLGMGVLDEEGVALDRMFAHGGVFRTAGVAQRFLAARCARPSRSAATASEGGPWGMAVLAVVPRHRAHRPRASATTSTTACSATPSSRRRARPRRRRRLRRLPRPLPRGPRHRAHRRADHLTNPIDPRKPLMTRSIIPDLDDDAGLVPHRQPGPLRRGDAAQVAEQSQGDRRPARRAVPVTIEWMPVLKSTDAIRRMAIDANADDSVIGVIAWMHTFSPAKMWITGLDAAAASRCCTCTRRPTSSCRGPRSTSTS